MGVIAKSYMRNSFQTYEEMCKYLVIYEEAISHIWLCNRPLLKVLIYEENCVFFFSSAEVNISNMDVSPSINPDNERKDYYLIFRPVLQHGEKEGGREGGWRRGGRGGNLCVKGRIPGDCLCWVAGYEDVCPGGDFVRASCILKKHSDDQQTSVFLLVKKSTLKVKTRRNTSPGKESCH